MSKDMIDIIWLHSMVIFQLHCSSVTLVIFGSYSNQLVLAIMFQIPFELQVFPFLLIHLHEAVEITDEFYILCLMRLSISAPSSILYFMLRLP